MTPPLLSGHATALRLLKDAVPLGGIVVDAGAFPGHLTRAMHTAGYCVIALDKDPSRGMGIQGRFNEGTAAHVDGEITYAEQMRLAGIESRMFDLEVGTYPVETGTADAIVFTEVIEHLYVDPLNALSEANRVLKPGGLCLLSTPNLLSLRNRVNVLRGRMDRVIEHPLLAFLQKHQIGHVGHVRLYAPQELIETLRVFGFDATITFRAFDFWDPVPGAAPTDVEPHSTRATVPVRSTPTWRRYIRSPQDYVRAAISTGRLALEHAVPHFRAHMFVTARKTREVRLHTLRLADVRRQLGR